MFNFLRVFQKILDLLDAKERFKLKLYIGLILVMAIFDMMGVASIIPFIAALSDPNIIETNIYLKKAFEISTLDDKQQFLFVLVFFTFLVLLISIVYKALVSYGLTQFINIQHYTLSCKLAKAYINQPYEFFMNKNSADLSKNILTEVSEVVKGVIVPTMDLFVSAFLSISLIVFLMLVNPGLTLLMVAGFGFFYVTIFLLTRKNLVRMGVERAKANGERFLVLSEMFGGVKEVKISNLESVYLKRFDRQSKKYAEALHKAQITIQIPRYLIEIFVFGVLLLVILYIMNFTKSLQAALPLISLYVFSAYKLMPALRDVFMNFSKLRFANNALQKLHTDFKRLNIEPIKRKANGKNKLEYSIKIEGVNYRYPDAKSFALKDLNLEIRAHSMVGLIGSSGSGKTTTIDLILGLLRPDNGCLKVDKVILDNEDFDWWRSLVGYVPQHIFLSDDTVAANIAFGVDKKELDNQAIERAAKVAKIHDFIVNDLPLAYSTKVGEGGVRLSGGQRQRIGIARAIYRNPQILVLDEATSALDDLTEHEIMEALEELRGKVTIIIIAHRLSTLRSCDRLFQFKKGRIIRSGSFEEIVKNNVKN